MFFAIEHFVDRYSGFVPVRDGPDDVLRAEGRVTAEENFVWVLAIVLVSTFGMSHWSNSIPISRSIHGNAFSWPTATSTSSQAKCWSGSPEGTSLRRPLASYSAFTFSKVMPVSVPFSCVNSFGTR